jgi:hypothetical protein
MTKSRFHSAKRLDIYEEWREALIKTLALMESGKLKKISLKKVRRHRHRPYETQTLFFNMGEWRCGSAGCIGGTAEAISGIKMNGYGSKPALFSLLFPRHQDYEKITVKQAAKALRNYLTTGGAQWEKIL